MSTNEPAGRVLEELVAEYYRAFGASTAQVDVRISGRQIDVYGARVRIAIECKDYDANVGADTVTEFAGVVALLRNDRRLDKAVIVTRHGYTNAARDVAAASAIDLLTVADLRARKENADAIDLLTIAREDVAISLRRDGRVLALPNRMRYSLYDENLVQRVKILAEFLGELEQLTLNPRGSVITVDATGAATEFTNWLSNPLYGAIMQASAAYAAAYRKHCGDNGVAVQRNFVLDPSEITPKALANLKQTLRLHTRYGLVAGILLKGSATPDEVIADIGDLAARVCLDFGLVEGFHGVNSSLRDVKAPVGNPQFKRIRDRVAWTTEPKNLHAVVTHEDEIADVIRSLSELLRIPAE
jgi:Restriction endonuclease